GISACVYAPKAFAVEIHRLLERDQVEQASALLAKEPKLVNARDESGQTPLHIASHRGHAGIVKLLLEQGADVNARDRAGTMPLHLADNLEIVKLLIAHKADLEARDRNDETALVKAAGYCLGLDHVADLPARAIAKA